MASTLTINNGSMAAAAAAGVEHFAAGDWSSSSDPRGEFLSALALRMVLIGYLVGSVSRQTNTDGATIIVVNLSRNQTGGERLAAARLLLAPLGIYADLAGIRSDVSGETGAVPVPALILGGVVAVSIVAAQAYVVTQVAEKAGEIVDGALKRNAAASEVQRADGEVLKLVNLHVEREQKSGAPLPLDEATKMALAGLQSRVGQLVQLGYQQEESKSLPSWVLPTAGIATAAVVIAIVYQKERKKNHGK